MSGPAAPDFAIAFGRALAEVHPDAAAVLFYGSTLRTGDREGVLDYYVLTHAGPRGLRGLASRLLWPDVGYREWDDGRGMLRAKVAVMTLAQFRHAAAGRDLDTTIWARFAQPAALVWSEGPQTQATVLSAMDDAVVTASRFAAALGPVSGPADAYWAALFRQTYRAEFRIEPRGRERAILAVDPAHYEAALRAGWRRGGIGFEETASVLRPELGAAERARLRAGWRLRRLLGPPRGLARIAKAAFTFDGAARYAAWKIERHTGVVVPLTPWRERHPLLAAPAALWRLWRDRR
jgi:hypothetical protein